MSVKSGNPVIDKLGKCRPATIALHPMQPVVKQLGLAEVGVDQTREDHPDQDRETERKVVPRETKVLRPQARGHIAKLVPPYRVDRLDLGGQPGVHVAGSRAPPVGQARMVPEYGIGNQFGHGAIARLDKIEEHLGASGRMINRSATAQPLLKRRRVLAQVMK